MRLTEKDDLGHWFLKGLEWGQLREGKVITKAVAQKLYGALCKLKDYEDTGCNSDDVERLNDFTQNEAVKLVQKLNAEAECRREEAQMDPGGGTAARTWGICINFIFQLLSPSHWKI